MTPIIEPTAPIELKTTPRAENDPHANNRLANDLHAIQLPRVVNLCSPASPRVSLLITSQFSSPGTPTKVHLPQQACSKGGAAFPHQLTSPHEYPHLCQNSGSNRFPQGFPFGGAHNAFLHAKPLAHGFPSPGGFPFLFFTFPLLAMLPQGCEDPQFPGGGQTAPKLPHATRQHH